MPRPWQNSWRCLLPDVEAGAHRVPMPNRRGTVTVRGVWKAAVFARMWMRGWWLALRAYRDPVRATRVVAELARSGARRGLVPPSLVPKVTRAAGRSFCHLYVPGFPSPAFDRYVEQELDRESPFLDGRRGLHSAVVAITRRCGLACEHCFEWEVLNHPGDALVDRSPGAGLAAAATRRVADLLHRRRAACALR